MRHNASDGCLSEALCGYERALCLLGRIQLARGIQKETQNEEETLFFQEHISMYILLWGKNMDRSLGWSVKLMGPANNIDGPAHIEPASNVVCRAGLESERLKICRSSQDGRCPSTSLQRAEPGRHPPNENLVGHPEPRPDVRTNDELGRRTSAALGQALEVATVPSVQA